MTIKVGDLDAEFESATQGCNLDMI